MRQPCMAEVVSTGTFAGLLKFRIYTFPEYIQIKEDRCTPVGVVPSGRLSHLPPAIALQPLRGCLSNPARQAPESHLRAVRDLAKCRERFYEVQ